LIHHRQSLETGAILILAVGAIVLELTGTTSVRGRDPFRVLLPALCTLVGVLLLELLVLTRELYAVARELLDKQRQMQADQSGEQYFDRIEENASKLPIVRRQGDHD
jgi:hypothetical protein